MIKVIYILSDSPPYSSISDDNKPNHYFINNNSWVGVFEDEWGHLIGNNIMKHSDNILFEFWRPDLRADKVYKKKFENGLVHAVFPAKQLSKEVYSQQIIDEINKERRNNQLVLNIGILKGKMNEVIIENFNNQIPIINNLVGNFSFINLSFGRNFLKWPNTYQRWRNNRSHIRKQKYISVGEYLPLEDKFISKYIKSHQILLHHSIGISEKYFSVNYNSELIRKKLNLPLEKLIFLSSSRLNSLKQIDKLIITFNKLKSDNAVLVITGAGTEEYKKYLQRLIEKSNKDIRLLNYLSEEDLISYYKAADYFIDASRNDGGPISAWKAMALGLPVITTATGNAGVFLQKQNSGLTIPVKKHSKWPIIFDNIISGQIVVKAADTKAVKKFLEWENCSRNNIANYYKVIEDFYGN